MNRMPFLSIGVLSSLLLAAGPAPLRADHDEIESPWGTIHGDLGGTAASQDLTYTLGEGPVEEKWRLDLDAEGLDYTRGRASITFDKDGNLYWITSATLAPGFTRLLSVSPDGVLRWSGNDAGAPHQLGTTFCGASPVVGQARVYGTGDIGGSLYVAAYDKATGQVLWFTDLSPTFAPNNQILTPVLRDGKLYVVGVKDATSSDFYRLDAETGVPDWTSTVSEVEVTAVGQMTFVADAFGAGVHGLYFNGDGAAPLNIVYGIRIEDGQASLGWKAPGGHVARSHVIHSPDTNLLYTLTWGDYGADIYVFDPATGFLSQHENALKSGHGFYDVGCLDFDGTIIGGGFEGNIIRYTDSGGGTITDESIFKGGFPSFPFNIPFWGETRVLGQLLQDASGNSVLVSGTNSFQCCASHIIALDLTNRRLLWEHDSGIRNDHNFIYAGGPIQGPDGKVYYMERNKDAAQSALVAIGRADAQPKPSAGFVVIDPVRAAADPNTGAVGTAGLPCVKAGDTTGLHGACSIGKDLVYRYSVDPPTAAVITHADDQDPDAEIVFKSAGQIPVTLQVEDAGGTAEWTQEICVTAVPPACSFKVTNEAGRTIDTADDLDGTPCLPVTERAMVDASASKGTDLEYVLSVTPLDGVSIDGDPASPLASISFTLPGIYTIGLQVQNPVPEVSTCGNKTICVKVLTAPQNLRVTDPKEKVALAWDKVADSTVQGYDLLRADTADGTYQKINPSVISKDVDRYEDLNVTVGEDYFYRLRAVYAANQASADSNTASATVERSQTRPTFRRGDVDGNRMVELTDVINLLGFLYLGTPPALACHDAADADDTGIVELTDAIYSLGFQFLGTTANLPDPGPYDCGPDPEVPGDTLPDCTAACL